MELFVFVLVVNLITFHIFFFSILLIFIIVFLTVLLLEISILLKLFVEDSLIVVDWCLVVFELEVFG